MNNNPQFTIGGALKSNDQFYIVRKADEALLTACQQGQFAYLLASRQIGKTSLMYAIAGKLEADDIRTVTLELNEVGSDTDAETWYYTLAAVITAGLRLELNLEAQWHQWGSLTLIRRFLNFLREIVLPATGKSPVVIFIDEIDFTLSFTFTDDLFAAIRAIYNDKRANPNSSFQRLTFVLIGVATPDELISEPTRTPFNIGQGIELGDFSYAECTPFEKALQSHFTEQGQPYFERVYHWTNGHPYLTQKLCAALIQTLPPKEEIASVAVDQVVQQIFLQPEYRAEDNLNFIFTRVMQDPKAKEMLGLYKKVLQGEEIEDDKTAPPINRLKLYGLLVERGGHLVVRNNLYRRVFNQKWVEDALRIKTSQGLPRRYKILQTLGEGSWATVYLAQETLTSGKRRPVALKILNPIASTDSMLLSLLTKFQNEARILQQLSHPNIIPIYDTDSTQTINFGAREIFIAMAYYPGGTLLQRVTQAGRIERNQAIGWLKAIGTALTYAHEQGVIHCDVELNNILLDTVADPPRPILSDFGLARFFSNLNQEADRHFKVTYIAPELGLGKSPSVATDVYGLGVACFHLLSGQPPFSGQTPDTLQEQHLRQPVPLLSEVALNIGTFFDDILLTAMAKAPDKRYQKVADFIDDLEKANQRAEVQARQERIATTIAQAQGALQTNPKHAIHLLESILQEEGKHSEALRLKAHLHRQQGEELAAFRTYRQAYQNETPPQPATEQGYFQIVQQLVQPDREQVTPELRLEIYRAIQAVLARTENEHHADWPTLRKQLITYHSQQGKRLSQQELPVNIKAIQPLFNQQLTALDTLRAEEASETLRSQIRDLSLAQTYYEGEQAYARYLADPKLDLATIDQTLQTKIEALENQGAYEQGKKLRGYRRELAIVRHHRRAETVYAQGNPPDLGGAITRLQAEITSLEALQAEESLVVVRDYLQELELKGLLKSAQATLATGQGDDLQVMIATLKDKQEDLRHTSLSPPKATLLNALETTWRHLQVRWHRQQGEKIYETGQNNLAEAIPALERELEALKDLQATTDYQVLVRYRAELLTHQLQHDIRHAEQQIAQARRTNDQGYAKQSTIFEHYGQIDKAYDALIELHPTNKTWTEAQRAHWQEEATLRDHFAKLALNQPVPDYHKAISHLQRLADLDEKVVGLAAQVGHPQLSTELEDLKAKSDYEEDYQQIRDSISRGAYTNARQLLEEKFIARGEYTYRQIARLLWGVVYASDYAGAYPPEWQYWEQPFWFRGDSLGTGVNLLEIISNVSPLLVNLLDIHAEVVEAQQQQLTETANQFNITPPPLANELQRLRLQLAQEQNSYQQLWKTVSNTFEIWQTTHPPQATTLRGETLNTFLDWQERDKPANDQPYPFTDISDLLHQTGQILGLLTDTQRTIKQLPARLAEMQIQAYEKQLQVKTERVRRQWWGRVVGAALFTFFLGIVGTLFGAPVVAPGLVTPPTPTARFVDIAASTFYLNDQPVAERTGDNPLEPGLRQIRLEPKDQGGTVISTDLIECIWTFLPPLPEDTSIASGVCEIELPPQLNGDYLLQVSVSSTDLSQPVSPVNISLNLRLSE